jgi:hypothetical protein
MSGTGLPAITAPDADLRRSGTTASPCLRPSSVSPTSIPNAQLRLFEGGHMFLIQDRAAFPAITEFLQAP